MIIDMHCHAHEYDRKTLEKFISSDIIIVSVADDYNSSSRNIELAQEFRGRVIPCVGIHPWEVPKHDLGDVSEIIELAVNNDVSCIGEVGLDKLFVAKTYPRQLEVFKMFLKEAGQRDFLYNLHTPRAWREVFDLLIKHDVKKAYFHWYTGPIGLLKDIEYMGYYIGINPAATIQEKHRKIIEKAPLKIMITESDGPYKYKSLLLGPELIRKTIEIISRVKEVEKSLVIREIMNNAKKILSIKT